MSKHHKHSRYGPQLVVEAPEHFTLQVLNQAEKSGAKVGAKIAKRALKNARGSGAELNALQTDELLLAAQQAGAAAAIAAARRVWENPCAQRNRFPKLSISAIHLFGLSGKERRLLTTDSASMCSSLNVLKI